MHKRSQRPLSDEGLTTIEKEFFHSVPLSEIVYKKSYTTDYADKIESLETYPGLTPSQKLKIKENFLSTINEDRVIKTMDLKPGFPEFRKETIATIKKLEQRIPNACFEKDGVLASIYTNLAKGVHPKANAKKLRRAYKHTRKKWRELLYLSLLYKTSLYKVMFLNASNRLVELIYWVLLKPRIVYDVH